MSFDARERARLLPLYRATTYRALTPPGIIDLRVGKPSPALDVLLDSLGAREWAFISAANPHSQMLTEAENEARHAALLALLGPKGHRFFEGQGVPDQPGWLPEPSLLIVGVSLAEGLALASSFAQNAILWGVRGGPARLAWCDSWEDASSTNPPRAD